MSKVMVILPAYNEEENIELMVERWQELRGVLLESYNLELQIVAVNDGSHDTTREIGQRLEKKYQNFLLINHPCNKGLGEAVKTGIGYFIAQEPEYRLMCLMDCDNTQDPLYITDMLARMEEKEADVVIASRYQKGAAVRGVSKLRLLMSGGARFVFSVLLSVPQVKDYTCGYRLYNRKILLAAAGRYGEGIVKENGFTCMVELLYKLYLCGAAFAEIPFSLRYDFKKGTSKMSVLNTAVRSIKLALLLRKQG